MTAAQERIQSLEVALAHEKRLRHVADKVARLAGALAEDTPEDDANPYLQGRLNEALDAYDRAQSALSPQEPPGPVLRRACMADVDRLYPPGTKFEDCPVCAVLVPTTPVQEPTEPTQKAEPSD